MSVIINDLKDLFNMVTFNLKFFTVTKIDGTDLPVNALVLYCELNNIQHVVIDGVLYATHSDELVSAARNYNPTFKWKSRNVASESFAGAVHRIVNESK